MDRKNDLKTEDLIENFQDQVTQVLVRHKSVLDIMTKLDEFNSRINRAVAKSVTSCGCISINAKKQEFGSESLEDMYKKAKSHLEGDLCDGCKDIIEAEIGAYIFYLASLCNTLDLGLSSIIETEYDRIKTLGIYSLK